MTFYTTYSSFIGQLLLISDGTSLTGLYMDDHQGLKPNLKAWILDGDQEPFLETKAQLKAYFDGKLKQFDLPLHMNGTDFQLQVWSELIKIPFATTISYGQLAERIGNPKGSRAVGLANGRNPISIIVPCHRVIGSNGLLTGYGGGLERKAALLDHENRIKLETVACMEITTYNF